MRIDGSMNVIDHQNDLQFSDVNSTEDSEIKGDKNSNENIFWCGNSRGA